MRFKTSLIRCLDPTAIAPEERKDKSKRFSSTGALFSLCLAAQVSRDLYCVSPAFHFLVRCAETAPTTRKAHHYTVQPGALAPKTWDFTFSGLAASFQKSEDLLPACLDDELRGVLRALLKTDQNFFPFVHILDLLNAIVQLVQLLHYDGDSPRPMLVTGPKGIGKSYLFRAIGHRDVLQAMRGQLGDCFSPQTATFSFHIDLLKANSWPSFTSWALYSTAAALGSGTNMQKAVSLIIRLLPAYIGLNQGDKKHKDFSLLSPECVLDAISQVKETHTELDLHESWWSEVAGSPLLGQERTPLEVMSCLLRHSHSCVLFIVDEAESLFQSSHYKYATAQLWLDQMQGTLDIVRPTFGIILCASFQRARQLFLYDGQQHEFPGHYKDHSRLRSNWNETKFEHLRVPPPIWSSHRLALFMLSHNANISQRRLATMAQRSRTLGAAASGVGDASNEAMPHEYFPTGTYRIDHQSSIILEEAKLLDQQFLRPANEEVTAQEIIEGALSLFLAKYGIIPRKLTAAIEGIHRSMLKVAGNPGTGSLPCRWPRPGQSRDLHRTQQYSSAAATAFEAYISLQSSNLRGASYLGYDPADFGASESQLFHVITREPGVDSLVHQVHVHRCVDAALDSGILSYLQDGRLALAEPAFYLHRICRGLVSHEAVYWMQHPGYGEKAELVLARALRRYTLSEGLGGMSQTGDVSVLAFGDKGSVEVSNEDSTAPPLGLATLNVIALQKEPGADGMRPLTEKAVSAAMVIEVFSKTVVQAVPSGRPHRAWLAAKRAAAAEVQDVCPETLAAFLSSQTTHPEVLSRLDMGVELQPVLLKESPDALGGDLVGIFPRETSDGVKVHIFRIQVKVATQQTLQAGPDSTASTDRCREAIANFLGDGVNVSMMAPDDPKQKAFKGLGADEVRQLGAEMVAKHAEAVAESLEQRHFRASSAIADVVAMSTALAGFKEYGHSCALSDKLVEYFEVCKSKASWVFHPPCLITTHTVKAAALDMARRCQVTVLDAPKLEHHWGRIGQVCQTLGILPFANEPTANPQSRPPGARHRRFGAPKSG